MKHSLHVTPVTHGQDVMMEIGGIDYPTVVDAAARFGVKRKTVYEWIKKGIIPDPPIKYRGTQKIRVFPEDYMEGALKDVEEKRQQPE